MNFWEQKRTTGSGSTDGSAQIRFGFDTSSNNKFGAFEEVWYVGFSDVMYRAVFVLNQTENA
jgi:hypothetical protein